jgi:hypothetical protein
VSLLQVSLLPIIQFCQALFFLPILQFCPSLSLLPILKFSTVQNIHTLNVFSRKPAQEALLLYSDNAVIRFCVLAESFNSMTKSIALGLNETVIAIVIAIIGTLGTIVASNTYRF